MLVWPSRSIATGRALNLFNSPVCKIQRTTSLGSHCRRASPQAIGGVSSSATIRKVSPAYRLWTATGERGSCYRSHPTEHPVFRSSTRTAKSSISSDQPDPNELAALCDARSEALVTGSQDWCGAWSEEVLRHESRHRSPQQDPRINDQDNEPGEASRSVYHVISHCVLAPKRLATA